MTAAIDPPTLAVIPAAEKSLRFFVAVSTVSISLERMEPGSSIEAIPFREAVSGAASMIRRLGISALVLAAFAATLLASVSAHAGGFGCGSYVWSSPYPADLTPLYSVGAIPLPPYFALHPPVYYEMPIPRTYGYGPWAYPPYMTTPEIVDPAPEIIQNKFVPPPIKQKSDKPKVAAGPLMIRNPYVIQPEEGAKRAFAAK